MAVIFVSLLARPVAHRLARLQRPSRRSTASRRVSWLELRRLVDVLGGDLPELAVGVPRRRLVRGPRHLSPPARVARVEAGRRSVLGLDRPGGLDSRLHRGLDAVELTHHGRVRRRRSSAGASRRLAPSAAGATLLGVLGAGLVAFILGIVVGASSGGGDEASEGEETAGPIELPRGGRSLLPEYRLVGFYGAPQDDALGALGVGTPAEASKRLARAGEGRTRRPAGHARLRAPRDHRRRLARRGRALPHPPAALGDPGVPARPAKGRGHPPPGHPARPRRLPLRGAPPPALPGRARRGPGARSRVARRARPRSRAT